MSEIYKAIPENNDIIYRLTALWAFSESGIGGFMFAFKIPLTGLLLGANAVILLTLIAYHAKHKFSEIIRATLLVLIVKLLVSPHSSPTAYLAVGFQGLLAATLFSSIRYIKLAAILLGIVSMMESALQKLLLLTIVFGTEFWEAINQFFQHLSKELYLNINVDYSYWIITVYILLFAFWGFFVGKFASALPAIINKRSNKILLQYQFESSIDSTLELPIKKKTALSLKLFLSILIPVSIVVAFSVYFPSKAWWLLGRTVLIIFLFYFVFVPLSRWLAQRWLAKRKSKDIFAAKQMIEFLPQVRKYFVVAYKMAVKENSYLKRLKAFIINVVIITLYAENVQHKNT